MLKKKKEQRRSHRRNLEMQTQSYQAQGAAPQTYQAAQSGAPVAGGAGWRSATAVCLGAEAHRSSHGACRASAVT